MLSFMKLSYMLHLFSMALNILCIILCIIGIFNGYSTIDLSPMVQILILIAAIIFLGYLEGLHFAVVSAQYVPLTSEVLFPRAYAIQQLILNETNAVKSFLIGRQFFVVFVVFLIAEITTFPRELKLR